MDQVESARNWFLKTALTYLGSPYIWGGDDPSGFDCSGLVNECLKTIGLLGEREDLTATGLRRRFAGHRVNSPRAGGLLFTLNEPDRASHVAICLDHHYQLAAAGGDSGIRDRKTAWRKSAFVKIRPIRLLAGRHEIYDPIASLKSQSHPHS